MILDKSRETRSQIVISPHGRSLVTQENRETFHVWNLKTGRLRFTIKEGFVHFKAFAFIHGGATLISMDRKHTMHLWDEETGMFIT